MMLFESDGNVVLKEKYPGKWKEREASGQVEPRESCSDGRNAPSPSLDANNPLQSIQPVCSFPLQGPKKTMPSHTSAPMQALYRVFVQPALINRTRSVALSHLPQLQTSRPFGLSTARLAAKGPPAKRKQLWDEEIPARRIQLVDPETGSLNPPQRLRTVLDSVDRKTYRLVCVTSPPAGDWTEEWIPTCKLVDKKVAYEAEKAKKKQLQAKTAAEGTKTLELNWAIDVNDLGHRMKRMQEFLAQGKKVELILARKKGGRRATPEECEALLQKINEAAEGVKGTKEVKKFEGKLAGMGQLMYEGPKP